MLLLPTTIPSWYTIKRKTLDPKWFQIISRKSLLFANDLVLRTTIFPSSLLVSQKHHHHTDPPSTSPPREFVTASSSIRFLVFFFNRSIYYTSLEFFLLDLHILFRVLNIYLEVLKVILTTNLCRSHGIYVGSWWVYLRWWLAGRNFWWPGGADGWWMREKEPTKAITTRSELLIFIYIQEKGILVI